MRRLMQRQNKMNKILILFCVSISSVFGATDIVVSNYAQCTDMAARYIQRNATPPELAIVVAVCEGILNPKDSGLGGGFQAVIYNGYCQAAKYLDAEVKAPDNFWNAATVSRIGIPSALKGYQSLYEMRLCGMESVLPWSELFAENIALAGNSALAQTLRRVAEEGPSSSLYREGGYLNGQMMQTLGQVGAHISSQDLSTYTTKTLDSFRYRCLNYTIATTRVPGSGSVLIFGCRIIQAAYPRLLSLSEDDRTVFMYHTLRYMLSMKPLLRSKFFGFGETVASAPRVANEIFALLGTSSSWSPKIVTKFGDYMVRSPFSHHITEPGVNSFIVKRGKYSIAMSNNRPFEPPIVMSQRFKSETLGTSINNLLYAFDNDDYNSPNRPSPKKAPQTQISPIIMYSKKTNPVVQIAASLDGDGIAATFNTLFNHLINGKSLKTSGQTPYCTPEYIKDDEITQCDENVSQGVKQHFERHHIAVQYKRLRNGVVATSTVKRGPEAIFDEISSGKAYINYQSLYMSKKMQQFGITSRPSVFPMVTTPAPYIPITFAPVIPTPPIPASGPYGTYGSGTPSQATASGPFGHYVPTNQSFGPNTPTEPSGSANPQQAPSHMNSFATQTPLIARPAGNEVDFTGNPDGDSED